jgi:hypothetical protein
MPTFIYTLHQGLQVIMNLCTSLSNLGKLQKADKRQYFSISVHRLTGFNHFLFALTNLPYLSPNYILVVNRREADKHVLQRV